jgi:Holliday junction resolvase RusA-like endonuclease
MTEDSERTFIPGGALGRVTDKGRRMLEGLPPPALVFTIPGAPRTKKNHGWRTAAGNQMPSHAYMCWNQVAQWHLAEIRGKAAGRGNLPITEQLNCRALFYRDAFTGDAVGYYQGLADALQEASIVKDDKLIVSWDGSRLLKDAANPRIEVTLEAIA